MTNSTVAPLPVSVRTVKTLGRRVNGHKWIQPKKAFRPAKGFTSYEKRNQKRFEMVTVKAKEKELKEEKERERRERITKIKERREAKAERERLAVLEAKMHKKRVERLKRKEKRNKLLHS